MRSKLLLLLIIVCFLTTSLSLAGVEACRGLNVDRYEPRNLDLYGGLRPEDSLKLLSGEWMVVSRINWFMKGWRCFSGDLSYAPSSKTLTASWNFKASVFGWQNATDSLTPSENPGQFFLNPTQLPTLLKWIVEKDRPIHIIDIAPPNKQQSQPEYVVLFDCGISLVPEGELFVLVRKGLTLESEKLEDIRQFAQSLGIAPFDLLSLDCS